MRSQQELSTSDAEKKLAELEKAAAKLSEDVAKAKERKEEEEKKRASLQRELAKKKQDELRLACHHNNIEKVKYLLEEGVDFDLPGSYYANYSIDDFSKISEECGSVIDNAIFYANTNMLDYLMPIYNELMEMRKVYFKAQCYLYKRSHEINSKDCVAYVRKETPDSFYWLCNGYQGKENFYYYRQDTNKLQQFDMDNNQLQLLKNLLADQKDQTILSLTMLNRITKMTKHQHLPALNLQITNQFVPSNTFQLLKKKFEDKLQRQAFICLTNESDGLNSPLIKALKCKKKELANLLVEKNYCSANEYAYGQDKEILGSALTLAIEFGFTDLALLLIKKGANLNVWHKVNVGYQTFKYTALMLAAKLNQVEVVKSLLEQGANILDRDRDYKTAIELTNNPEIKSLINQYTLTHRLNAVTTKKMPDEFACPLQRLLYPEKPPLLITDPITDPGNGVTIDRQTLIDANANAPRNYRREDLFFIGTDGEKINHEKYDALLRLPQTQFAYQVIVNYVKEQENLDRQKQQVHMMRPTMFPYQ